MNRNINFMNQWVTPVNQREYQHKQVTTNIYMQYEVHPANALSVLRFYMYEEDLNLLSEIHPRIFCSFRTLLCQEV